MRIFLTPFLLLSSLPALAAEIFMIQPAEISVTTGDAAEQQPAPESEEAAWLDRVASILSEARIGAVGHTDTAAATQTLLAKKAWQSLLATDYQSNQAPALAQKLKSTELNTLVIAEADFLTAVLKSLGNADSKFEATNRQLIHQLRIHDGRVVESLNWNAAGGPSTTGDGNDS